MVRGLLLTESASNTCISGVKLISTRIKPESKRPKPRLLRRVQSRWGFQRGEAEALPFGRTRGFKPRVRYNLIAKLNNQGFAVNAVTTLLPKVWAQRKPRGLAPKKGRHPIQAFSERVSRLYQDRNITTKSTKDTKWNLIIRILRGSPQAHYPPACAGRWGFPRGGYNLTTKFFVIFVSFVVDEN